MYRKSSTGWLKHFDFMMIDLLCLEISYFVAYSLRHSGNSFLQYDDVYRNMFLVLLFLQVVTVFFFETFKNVLKRGLYAEFVATLYNAVIITLASAFYLFLTNEGNQYSRITLISTGVLYFILSYATRLLWKYFLNTRWKDREGSRSLLIISSRSMMSTVIENIKNNNYQGFRIAGVVLVDKDMEGQNVQGIPVVANISNVAEYICREWVDEVFINLPANLPLDEELINKFVMMGVTVHVKLAKVKNLLGQKQFVEKLGTYTVLSTSVNMATTKQLFFKRVLDICGGLVGCIMTGIMAIFVCPLIYIKSPGPVFFSQLRVGKNGRKFKMYKFRSMYLDAEERKKELMEQNRVSDGMMFKLDFDPRIIGSEKGKNKGIGNFIRKTSIDEFPQFWNVLKGDMSLVGTRPPTIDEWEKYDLHHRARLAIKPGLTGMWQVSGRSDITDFEEVVKLDTEYIQNWSFGLDVKILLKTVLVVLRHDGSM